MFKADMFVSVSVSVCLSLWRCVVWNLIVLCCACKCTLHSVYLLSVCVCVCSVSNGEQRHWGERELCGCAVLFRCTSVGPRGVCMMCVVWCGVKQGRRRSGREQQQQNRNVV